MTSIRLAALALTAVMLAGCQSAAEIRVADENRCASYGFRTGTDAFATCLQRIDLQRRAELDASTRAALYRAQYSHVVVHHHHHRRR